MINLFKKGGEQLFVTYLISKEERYEDSSDANIYTKNLKTTVTEQELKD
jgi:hypothetical protein